MRISAKKATTKKNETVSNTPAIVNPAEISLGGDAIDWTKKEVKVSVWTP